MTEMPSREELEAVFGPKPAQPTREELEGVFGRKEPPSWGEWLTKQGAGFATGVGEVVPFGQDVPAAIAAGLSKAGIGPRYVPNEGTFEERFSAAKNAQRRAAEQMGKEAPSAQLAGNAAGIVGTISPLSRVAAPVEAAVASKVAPVLGETAGAATGMGVSGAGIGAAQGFGEGTTLDERLGGAGTGALVGAGLGAAVPLAAKVIGSAVQGARNALNPSAKINSLATKDVRRGLQPLTPEEIAAAQANKQPLMPIDLGGKALHEEARRVANVSDDASSELNNALRERQGEHQQRYVDYLSGMSRNKELDAAGVADRLREEARALNKPNYEKAYEAGAAGVWNPELFRLVNSPSIKRAIPDAVEKLQERAILEGRGPISNPFTQDKAGNYFLREGFKPDLEFWDGVKRSLDDEIGALDRAGKYDSSRGVKAVREKLLGQLDSAVPEFATAREGAAKAFAVDNAFDAGLSFLGRTNAKGISEGVAAFRRMSVPEQNLFREGVLQDLLQKVKTPDEGRDLTRLFNNAAMRYKLNVVLGPQQAGELEAFTRIEQLMQASHRAVQANSTTAQQGARMGWLGHKVPHTLPYVGFEIAGLHGGVAGVVADAVVQKILSHIDKARAARIAEKLVSKNPDDIRAVLSTIAADPQAMVRLRRLTLPLATLGSAKLSLPAPRKQRAAGGSAREEHMAARARLGTGPLARLAARDLNARRAVEGDAEAVAALDKETARQLVRLYVEAHPSDLDWARTAGCAVQGKAAASGVKRLIEIISADTPRAVGTGIPRHLRNRFESWAAGQNARELGRLLAHPEAAPEFTALGRSDFDSQEWRRALIALGRLAGNAAARSTWGQEMQGVNRQGRASGGALNRAAETARRILAEQSRPLMDAPDEAVAAALRLAARR